MEDTKRFRKKQAQQILQRYSEILQQTIIDLPYAHKVERFIRAVENAFAKENLTKENNRLQTNMRQGV